MKRRCPGTAGTPDNAGSYPVVEDFLGSCQLVGVEATVAGGYWWSSCLEKVLHPMSSGWKRLVVVYHRWELLEELAEVAGENRRRRRRVGRDGRVAGTRLKIAEAGISWIYTKVVGFDEIIA